MIKQFYKELGFFELDFFPTNKIVAVIHNMAWGGFHTELRVRMTYTRPNLGHTIRFLYLLRLVYKLGLVLSLCEIDPVHFVTNYKLSYYKPCSMANFLRTDCKFCLYCQCLISFISFDIVLF